MHRISYRALFDARKNIHLEDEPDFAHSFISPLAHTQALYLLARQVISINANINDVDLLDKNSLQHIIDLDFGEQSTHVRYLDDLANSAHLVITHKPEFAQKVMQTYSTSLYGYANNVLHQNNVVIRKLHAHMLKKHLSALYKQV